MKAKKLGFLKVVSIALKAGRVTRKYPYERPLVTDEFRGKVEIDPGRCIGCGACVNACPPNALSLRKDDKRLVIEYFIGRCIFCWLCVDVCPTGAMKGTKDFELTSDDISDLYYSVVHDIVSCSKCGMPFTAKKMVEYIVSKSPYIEKYIMFDPECRRKIYLNNLLRRFGGSYEEN